MQALRNPRPRCTMGTLCVTLLYFSQGLKSKFDTPKPHALPWDWTTYMLKNIDTVIGSVLTHWGLCDEWHSLKSKRILTLTSYNFCISTWTLKYKMMICVICDCYLDETILHPIQQPNFCPWSSKCRMPTIIGPHNLTFQCLFSSLNKGPMNWIWFKGPRNIKNLWDLKIH